MPPDHREADLLASGEERPPWRLGVRSRRAVVVLLAGVAAAGVGLAVQDHRAEQERRQQAAADAEVLRLSLRPGQDAAVRYGPSRPRLELAVVNSGPAPVRLLWGTLVPGEWQVQVPPDPEVRPGESAVLSLTPPATCGTRQARRLRVDVVLASGRAVTAELPLAGARLVDGSRLDGALAAASFACAPQAPRASDGRTYPHRSEVVRPSR